MPAKHELIFSTCDRLTIPPGVVAVQQSNALSVDGYFTEASMHLDPDIGWEKPPVAGIDINVAQYGMYRNA